MFKYLCCTVLHTHCPVTCSLHQSISPAWTFTRRTICVLISLHVCLTRVYPSAKHSSKFRAPLVGQSVSNPLQLLLTHLDASSGTLCEGQNTLMNWANWSGSTYITPEKKSTSILVDMHKHTPAVLRWKTLNCHRSFKMLLYITKLKMSKKKTKNGYKSHFVLTWVPSALFLSLFPSIPLVPKHCSEHGARLIGHQWEINLDV